MNYKDFFFDKAFWILIWPTFRGCVIYSLTTLILLFILAVVSQPISLWFEALQVLRPQIVRWSIVITVLFNLGALLLSSRAMAQYLSEPPLELENLKLILKEIGERNKKLGRTIVEDVVPFIFLLFVASGLFNAYILKGSSPQALQSSVTFVLPFSIALSAAYWFRILVLIGFLHLKYVIQPRE
jgi:uncharacterized protein YneF (UPF0154 family)